MSPTDLPPDVRTVVSSSFLAELPAEVSDAVLSDGHRIELAPGTPVSDSRDAPTVALVVDGLVRVFLESDAGRQVTVRYARPGDVLGLVHLLGAMTAAHGAAVTRTRLWVLRGDRVLAGMGRDPALACAVARECAARTADSMEELALTSFGSVRARLARHLLDLAAPQPHSVELVAAVTQQQLAAAIGSVREVVARSLGEFRAEGIVGDGAGGIAILDARALDEIASGR